MIGRLKGTLSEIEGTQGLIETASGVFYQVFLTRSILNSVHVGSAIEIYTYLQVREDALVLFGFKTKDEKQMFMQLLDVPGVGPKSAYKIISFAKISEFIDAVKQNDVNYFSQIPGLGKKTSLKIILELSQKFKTVFMMQTDISDEDKTVIEALSSLGFSKSEGQKVLLKLPKNDTVEAKITRAIQLLSGKK